MIVVDASVLVTALTDDHTAGHIARRRLRDQTILAPELIYVEVVSALRRLVRAGVVDQYRADEAVGDLSDLALRPVPHLRLLPRIWELRGNFSSYDAAYVATAELLGAALVTADARLAAAPGSACTIEVLTAQGD